MHHCTNTFHWNKHISKGQFKEMADFCGIMSISNMMYPEWHPVPCDISISVDIICRDQEYETLARDNYYETYTQSVNGFTNCKEMYILFQDNCYLPSSKLLNVRYELEHTSKIEILFMNVVLRYISNVAFANFIYCFQYSANNHDFCYTFDFLTQNFEISSRQNNEQNIKLYIYKEQMINSAYVNNKETQVYECNSGEYISKALLHNDIENCASGDDERNITCLLSGKIMNGSFCITSCSKSNCTCQDLYHHKQYSGCIPFSTSNMKSKMQMIKAKAENIISESLLSLTETVSYLYTDCTEEELAVISRNVTLFTSRCDNEDLIQCTLGCKQCFSITKICVYELDDNGNLMHCPSGSHLKNCTDMECNNMFKCFKKYCIPYR